MKALLLAATALTLGIAPAQAQLLGGSGGLTGGLTSGLGSGVDLDSTITSTTQTLRSASGGTAGGTASTEGNQSVDRRSGRVEARRSARVDSAANIAQLIDTPVGAVGAIANGSGGAAGEGNAQAALVGTDALRPAAAGAVGAVRSTVATAGGTQQLLTPAFGNIPAPATGGVAGGGAANGNASGNGSASALAAPLTVAGSAASAAAGAVAIAPGTLVFGAAGEKLGMVREIVANSRGGVEQVVVASRQGALTIPAGQLSASGSALVMGEAATHDDSDIAASEPAG
ncbi:MAG: hypothetical protein SFV20_12075 [Sphingopyxis sp.]|nr:hypothetical protein [Sphingopyxis sp.]